MTGIECMVDLTRAVSRKLDYDAYVRFANMQRTHNEEVWRRMGRVQKALERLVLEEARRTGMRPDLVFDRSCHLPAMTPVMQVIHERIDLFGRLYAMQRTIGPRCEGRSYEFGPKCWPEIELPGEEWAAR
jgi:hypothetical protein